MRSQQQTCISSNLLRAVQRDQLPAILILGILDHSVCFSWRHFRSTLCYTVPRLAQCCYKCNTGGNLATRCCCWSAIKRASTQQTAQPHTSQQPPAASGSEAMTFIIDRTRGKDRDGGRIPPQHCTAMHHKKYPHALMETEIKK